MARRPAALPRPPRGRHRAAPCRRSSPAASSTWRPRRRTTIELHATDPDGPVDRTIVADRARRAPSRRSGDARSPHGVSNAARRCSRARRRAARATSSRSPTASTPGPSCITASGTAANPDRHPRRPAPRARSSTAAAARLQRARGLRQLRARRAAHAAGTRTAALRFQGVGAEGNVVRRVHIRDVTARHRLATTDQRDFYLCDNVVEGRLVWPHVYTDDGGAHSDDDGIHVEGNGHVVCHNQVSRLRRRDQDRAGRARVRSTSTATRCSRRTTTAIELDGSEGNTRALPQSLHEHLRDAQLPAGLRRARVRDPQRGRERRQRAAEVPRPGHVPPQEPSGMLVLHNTFVSPGAGAQPADARPRAITSWSRTTCSSARARRDRASSTGPGRIDDGTLRLRRLVPRRPLRLRRRRRLAELRRDAGGGRLRDARRAARRRRSSRAGSWRRRPTRSPWRPQDVTLASALERRRSRRRVPERERRLHRRRARPRRARARAARRPSSGCAPTGSTRPTSRSAAAARS